MRGADIICECLLAEGVEAIFGHPGGAVLPLYDAFWKYEDRLKHILVRHEQCAAHAADGYYRACGKMAVCVATSGPGATNLVTGLMAAKADSVPLVAITGQVPRPMMGKEAFQECATCAITAPVTKKNYQVLSADKIVPTLAEAFYTATEGRPGPVLVDVPRDVQQEEADFTEYRQVVKPSQPPQLSPETLENVRLVAQLINEAQKPLFMVGHGVLLSKAWNEVRALVEKTGVPVITTLLGLGAFPGNHPLSLGMLGMHGMYWCNLGVERSDLVVGLGVRFDDRVIGRPGTFAPRAKVVHLDVDPGQIGKLVRVDVPLVGDARAVVQALLPRVHQVDRSPWLGELQQLREEHPSLYVPEDGKLPAQFVLSQLNKVLQEQEDVVVVTGVGQHQMWAAQYLTVNSPNSFVSSGGLGAMGYEVPAAMGAQVARPHASVWSVAGDGGFQMTMQDLATIVQEALPVKFAIINNGYLGMVRQWQELFYNRHFKAVPIPGPDYAKLAECFGMPGMRVERREEVMPALLLAQRHRGPFLLDFRVDAEENCYPMVAPGKTLGETVEDPRAKAPVASVAGR
jgi:acetolactate synthase-1/2/3 large subunit